jgi:tRNA A-37 threonylcarbamoyl transferase component Bud32
LVSEDARGLTPATAPADPALPCLTLALDAVAMAPRLAAVLGEHGRLEVDVLKHAAGKRCVIAYRFADGTRAVGKMYRKDRAVRQAARLQAAGAALQGSTRVPRLLACWEDLGLVLQEWAPGEPLPDYAGLADHPALVERIGVALAGLHAAALDAGPWSGLAEQLRRTCKPGLGALAADRPDCAADLHALETGMYAVERTATRTARPCHGDFSPRQLFVAGPDVYVVDLDGMSASDAALDVACFRVGLEAHLGAGGQELSRCFLSAYLRASGLAALPALPAYEAWSELRRAMILWRKRPPGWESDLRRGLARGRTRLAAATSADSHRCADPEGNC